MMICAAVPLSTSWPPLTSSRPLATQLAVSDRLRPSPMVNTPPSSTMKDIAFSSATSCSTVWPACTTTFMVGLNMAGPGVPLGRCDQMGSERLPLPREYQVTAEQAITISPLPSSPLWPATRIRYSCPSTVLNVVALVK